MDGHCHAGLIGIVVTQALLCAIGPKVPPQSMLEKESNNRDRMPRLVNTY